MRNLQKNKIQMKWIGIVLWFFLITVPPLWAGPMENKIKLIVENHEIFVEMYDTPTSRDFMAMLPLTLTFEDYARTEKIASLPQKLSTQKAPSGCTPSAGDFTYYAPWGNLAIFYADFHYSNHLIRLGKIENGLDILKAKEGSFSIRMERVGNASVNTK